MRTDKEGSPLRLGAPKDLVTALGTAAYELVLPPPWTEEGCVRLSHECEVESRPASTWFSEVESR